MTNIEEKTLFLDEFCRDNKIPFIDIGLDMDDPNNNNKPHDGHPSPSAHNQFAKSIYTFLQAEELIHLK